MSLAKLRFAVLLLIYVTFMTLVKSCFRDLAMVVQTEQIKRDEQHPLLKVDTGGPGGGDTGLPQRQPSAILTPGWNVSCVPKRSWLDRWPEFFSACWMTLILLGITFLVFYALGMNAYRRQSLIIVKCNASKPENTVYFHHIIPRGTYLPFSLYSDYLSSMAMEYPFLYFNVHFLVDDSHDPVYGLKHSKMFKRLTQPILNDVYPTPMNERDKQELKMFQQRYGNINITIMTLSHYMSLTPLKCKWKMIPIYYLPFYARIATVWENGGIGLDLISLNDQFNNNQMPDRRITAILRQHNDGIEDKKYIQTLNTINHQEQTEFSNMFYNLITNIFARSDAFFDNPLFELPVLTSTNNSIVTMSRNYRNKRENAEIIANKTGQVKSNVIVVEETKNTNASNKKGTDLYSVIINSTYNKANLVKNNSLVMPKENATTENNISKLENKLNVTKFENEIPHVILFYDFSIFPDGGIGPSYSIPEALQKPKSSKTTKRSPYPVSITYDGTFIAATSRHHPFLGHVLSSISSRVSPRLAIENALSFQCPGLLKNDDYCENIYILN